MSKGRWKQVRGRIHKMWGKLTHNPCAEFLGERDIIEGKLEEYYANRSSDFRDARQPVRTDSRSPLEDGPGGFTVGTIRLVN